MLITDLFARKLPSLKGSDVQYLLGGGEYCKFIGKFDNCFEFTFHIPTIYSLSTLCEYIRKDIELFYSTNNIPKKLHIWERVNSKRMSLKQAIDQLGKSYVFGCLGMSKDNFLNKIIVFNANARRLLN